jgi:plastocyanin
MTLIRSAGWRGPGGPLTSARHLTFLFPGVWIVRWRKAAVSVTAVVLALGVAAGCSETDPDEARTPESAATVANSALQTDSEGKTVAAPGAEGSQDQGGEAGAQTNTGAEIQGGGVTDDLSEQPGGGNQSGGSGGGGEESGGAPGGDAGGGDAAVEIPADEQALAYQKTEVTAKAGSITLRSPNPSPIPHNIAVDEPEQALGEVVQNGGVSEITVDFPAGEYEYYCSVPGHREAGMVGTLTVE